MCRLDVGEFSQQRDQVLWPEDIAGALERQADRGGDLGLVGGRKRGRRGKDIALRIQSIDRAPLLLHLRSQLGVARPIIMLRLQDDVAIGCSVPPIYSIVRSVRKCFETDSQLPAE